MAKIVFYCHVEKSMLETVEFYKQDIDALRELGHQVIICTKYREIPFDFDAMFIWWWTYALWPTLLCRVLRKPCMITGTYNFRFPESFNERDYFRRPWWQRSVIKYASTLTSLNLFVSQFELKGCSEYFALNNSRYFPHILHKDYLKGPGNNRVESLLNISYSRKENLVRKGIPELLKSVRLLKDEGFEIKLKLAGHKGDGVDYLMKTIDNLNINENVCYLGQIKRQEKIELLRQCEIYVQPSHYEGFGVAIAEAMGCGACIITCDVGEVKSVVGDCGIFVSPGSPEELAKAIKALIEDRVLRRNLQEHSYQRACKLFRADNKLERLRSYLLEVGIPDVKV